MIAKWRVQVLGNVLWDAWPALLAIGGLGLAWGLGWGLGSALHARASDRILYAGMIIELLGIGLVMWDLGETLKKFGRPSLVGQVGGWFIRLRATLMPARSVMNTGTGQSVSSGLGIGRGVRTPGKDATSEERISALEDNLNNFRNEMDATISRMNRELVTAKQSITQANQEMKEATQAIDRKIEDLAVGGTHLDVIGLSWIAVGVFWTNVPEAIAGWLGYA